MIQGIAIGNLTSQIFANIYLNELDRFVSHTVRPVEYLRYGDDFIVVMKGKEELEKARLVIGKFLSDMLKLELNPKNDVVVKTSQGIHFLGVDIFPCGRRLKQRNIARAVSRIDPTNVSSYRGLIVKHSKRKVRRHYDWLILEKLTTL